MTRRVDKQLTARSTAGAARIALTAALLAILALPSTAGAAPAPPLPSSTTSTTNQSTPAAPQSTPAGQISWGIAPARNSFGSDRAHFTYTLDPGARFSDAIVVTNHSTKAITLRTYASDAFTTPDGGIDVQAADAKATDVGAWITMRTTVSIAAGKSATVPFTMTVPSNATPGDHAGGVVTSLIDSTSGSTVRVDHRLGSRVYIRVTGTLKPQLALTDVHATYDSNISPVGTGDMRITYTVSNTGNVRLAAHQSALATGPWGMLSSNATLADLPEILPGNSLTNTVTVTGVWPAIRLTTHIDLTPVAGSADPGGRIDPVSTATTTWAVPWGLILFLVVLAGAVVAIIASRRRQKRHAQAAIADAVAAALSEPKSEAQ